ncbi:MAG: hypothetical protein WCI57_01920 [Candidatus Berkelbacteria bacterium]
MKRIWIIVITAVATAAIVGGGTWYLIDSHAKKDKDKLQTELDTLNQRLADEAATSGIAVTSGTTAADPIAGWKNYFNQKYGYTVDAPAEYNVEFECGVGATKYDQLCATRTDNDGLNLNSLYLDQKTTTNAIEIKLGGMIFDFNLPAGETDPLGMIRALVPSSKFQKISNTVFKSVTVGDVLGYSRLASYYVEQNKEGVEYTEDYFFVNGTNLYRAQLRYIGAKDHEDEMKANMAVDRKILSTFAFVQ